MVFKDHFSGHAGVYAQARPCYPEALFAELATLSGANSLAWDCGTGNGQAARQLAPHFARVIASDASARQIQAATPVEGVEFRVFPAEQAELEPQSVDLVTVAQALHWFDIDGFFSAVDRVLKPGGLLAVWSYRNCRINTELDQVIQRLYGEILEPYWPPERRLVEQRYAGIEFPYRRLDTPSYDLQLQWQRQQLRAYLESWSATRRYQKACGVNPLTLIDSELSSAWGAGLQKTVIWPLTLIVCRK